MLLPGEADLAFIPMAVRRALDRAGLRITLEAWRTLPEAARAELCELGARPTVPVEEVARAVAALGPVAIEPSDDPSAETVPPRVEEALGPPPEVWRRLGPVARHALDSYARRGRDEKLRALYDALTSLGESQSRR